MWNLSLLKKKSTNVSFSPRVLMFSHTTYGMLCNETKTLMPLANELYLIKTLSYLYAVLPVNFTYCGGNTSKVSRVLVCSRGWTSWEACFFSTLMNWMKVIVAQWFSIMPMLQDHSIFICRMIYEVLGERLEHSIGFFFCLFFSGSFKRFFFFQGLLGEEMTLELCQPGLKRQRLALLVCPHACGCTFPSTEVHWWFLESVVKLWSCTKNYSFSDFWYKCR